MILAEKKTVLDYVGDDNEVALYMGDVGDRSTPPTRLLITVGDREAMGCPEQVTVTISVGNRPSDADAAFQAPHSTQ